MVGVGADPNALDFDREVRRLREKAAAGADYITTQPVFDPDALFRFLDAIDDLQLPVIAGIWPLASLRNAMFMKNEVPGVTVPDWVIERMTKASTNEEQLATGIAIAREAIEAIRDRVRLSRAPFGKVENRWHVGIPALKCRHWTEARSEAFSRGEGRDFFWGRGEGLFQGRGRGRRRAASSEGREAFLGARARGFFWGERRGRGRGRAASGEGRGLNAEC